MENIFCYTLESRKERTKLEEFYVEYVCECKKIQSNIDKCLKLFYSDILFEFDSRIVELWAKNEHTTLSGERKNILEISLIEPFIITDHNDNYIDSTKEVVMLVSEVYDSNLKEYYPHVEFYELNNDKIIYMGTGNYCKNGNVEGDFWLNNTNCNFRLENAGSDNENLVLIKSNEGTFFPNCNLDEKLNSTVNININRKTILNHEIISYKIDEFLEKESLNQLTQNVEERHEKKYSYSN
jgi:hypothetical protein